MKDTEIERRWLIPVDQFQSKGECLTKIKKLGKDQFIRVRKSSRGDFKMCYKYGTGLTRVEIEGFIPEEAFNEFDAPIHVMRVRSLYLEGIGKFDIKWIDELNICIAELEFDTELEAKMFELMLKAQCHKEIFSNWIEVTEDPNFSYVNLYTKVTS